MLRLLRLAARTSTSVRGTAYLRSVQNRAYSSNPLQSHLDIIQSSASKNSRNNVIGARRSWATEEDTETLNRLLHLAKSRQFDELFKALEQPSLTRFMFVKVIQFNWQLLPKKEIEMKEKVMGIMRERGVIHNAFSITPMISLYGKVGDSDKADGLLRLMKENGIERNVSIYNSLMKCHLNDTVKVEDLHFKMTADGIKPNVYIYNTMIRAFSKDAAKVDELYRKMFKEEIKPDVYIYSLMIDVYAKSGKLEMAVEVFDSMKAEGIPPCEVTFTTLINAFSKNGKLENAVELFVQ
jgi:pentatricopeptide repeat protein